MQTPIIVSASRSTDIPAFYADWFFHRLEVGYSAWTNPFNRVRSYVSYKNTRFIIFWSKNPRPLLPFLPLLEKRGIGCYIQYTLNDYEKDNLEKGVPPLEERIETFKRLVDALGVGHVIWRFDPLVLTDKIDIDCLLSKIEYIGDALRGYTEKLVFSYADIGLYRKVKVNLEHEHIAYQEWNEELMVSFASHLAQLNKKWRYELGTCSERIDLSNWGIKHNRCIDDDLMIRFSYSDKELMKFLKVKMYSMPERSLFGDEESIPENAIFLPNHTYALHGNNRDVGQREFCGCVKSKDIGEYDTCPHLCEYCYANTNKQIACRNYRVHMDKPYEETITGL